MLTLSLFASHYETGKPFFMGASLLFFVHPCIFIAWDTNVCDIHQSAGTYNPKKGCPCFFIVAVPTCIQTTDGNCCVFPFIYNSQQYNQCTSVDWTKDWCATTSNYDIDKMWGECGE